MANAFEDQEPQEPVLPPNPEIARMENKIRALKNMGMYRTAEVVQRKLDRLLQEEEGTLEG